MTISRRGLIGGILALGVAPSIVRAASIMPVKTIDTGLNLADELAALAEFGGKPDIFMTTDNFWQELIQYRPNDLVMVGKDAWGLVKIDRSPMPFWHNASPVRNAPKAR